MTTGDLTEGFDKATFDRIAGMSADEKLALIRKALYSDEHMLKILVRIMLIADPESADDILEWFNHQGL